jgi:hypothetical protein
MLKCVKIKQKGKKRKKEKGVFLEGKLRTALMFYKICYYENIFQFIDKVWKYK